ncbi:MAG: peptidylprolyl isomerase [Magnetococcus sp. WYHC-3]
MSLQDRTFRWPALAGVALFSALVGAAPQLVTLSGPTTPAWVGGPPVAEMGTITLTRDHARNALSLRFGAQMPQVLANSETLGGFLKGEVVAEFLAHQAEESGLDQTPELQFLLARQRRDLLAEQYLSRQAPLPDGYPDEETLQRTYRENIASFLSVQPQVHLAQVFLKWPDDTATEARQAVRANAEHLLTQIQAGKLSLEDAARKHSDHASSKAQGGDLGWQEMPALIPVIRQAVAGLEPGSLAPLVESDGGLHLLKVLETRPGVARPYDQVRPNLIRPLQDAKRNQERLALVQKLSQAHPLRIDPAPMMP